MPTITKPNFIHRTNKLFFPISKFINQRLKHNVLGAPKKWNTQINKRKRSLTIKEKPLKTSNK